MKSIVPSQKMAAFVILLFLAGCGATPMEKSLNAYNMHTAAGQTLLEAKPFLSQDTYNNLAAGWNAFRPTLQELQRSAVQGNSMNFNRLYDDYRKKLNEWLVKVASHANNAH